MACNQSQRKISTKAPDLSAVGRYRTNFRIEYKL